jgi:hypothetical protein
MIKSMKFIGRSLLLAALISFEATADSVPGEAIIAVPPASGGTCRVDKDCSEGQICMPSLDNLESGGWQCSREEAGRIFTIGLGRKNCANLDNAQIKAIYSQLIRYALASGYSATSGRLSTTFSFMNRSTGQISQNTLQSAIFHAKSNDALVRVITGVDTASNSGKFGWTPVALREYYTNNATFSFHKFESITFTARRAVRGGALTLREMPTGCKEQRVGDIAFCVE